MVYQDEVYVEGLHPFIDYIHEDKSIYPFASSEGYVDDDNDFLIGRSGGFLMNIDFVFVNTVEFSRVAEHYQKHGVYTFATKGSKAYKEFWQRETDRRQAGMTLNCKLPVEYIDAYNDPNVPQFIKETYLLPLRITGDHYNYLNYGRIMRTPTEEERLEIVRKRKKGKKVAGFPKFWDGDYWNFKIDEFVSANDFHLCKAKARRKGYSFKRGSQAANTINSTPNITIILAAYLTDYLTEPGATSDMLKTNLDWYEDKTYWKRGYISQSLETIELGYKKRGEGAKKYGFKSKALSVTLFNNPSAPIGKDAVEIDYEEAGKCFGKGTRFLMYDGNLKEVENIQVGDLLMGRDSTPRTVLATQQGVDKLYKIIPLNGIPHIINSKHGIHTLYRAQTKNTIVPKLMTADEYISMLQISPRKKDLYSLEKVGVEFEHKDVLIESYIFGLWIGDGDKYDSQITNIDKEVIDYLSVYAKKHNLRIYHKKNNNSEAIDVCIRGWDDKKNWFRSELGRMNVLGHKYVPDEYIFTDTQSRLEFLAGVIDTDGNYDVRKGNFEVIQKEYQLAETIAYIARSLGMKTTLSEKVINGVTYYRTLILSDVHRIPTKILRKQAEQRTTLQKNPLETRFDVEEYGEGDYYGFTVDKDHLVLLEDFTVVHNCPNLEQAIELAMSGTESGDMSTGTIRVYGTGGAKDADWRPFSNLFYNPASNTMMPFENVWDDAARYEVCGFFHPQIWNYEPHMDEHGNSLVVKSFHIDKAKKELAKKNRTTEKYLLYVGQRANSPSEAFNTGHENIFSSAELLDHLKDIETRERSMKFRDGQMVYGANGIEFKTNGQLEAEGNKVHPYINEVPFKLTQDLHGCWREYYPPFKIDGEIPNDLYYMTIDPVGKDKEMKELTTKNSLLCIQIYMYPNDISNSAGDILVAQFIGRPPGEDTAASIAIAGCERYRAKALPETDRGTIVADFRRAKKLHLLLRDPTFVVTAGRDVNSAPFGINIGSGSKAEDGLIYYRDYLYEKVGVDDNGKTLFVLHYIQDLGLLRELVTFRKNGNFDRISTARVMVFQRISYRTKRSKPKAPTTGKTVLGSLGLYRHN